MKKLSIWRFGIVFCLIGCLIVVQTVVNRNRDLQINMPGQFALMGYTPIRIQNGKVYQYEADGVWKDLEVTTDAKQILSGEDLCILNRDGSLYYDGLIEIELDSNRNFPLSAGHSIYMKQKVLAINKEEPFAWLNKSLDLVEETNLFLLQSGEILYALGDEYERYSLEEKPIQLSESYILTEKGNVYVFDIVTKRSGEVIPTFECIYKKEDIVMISSCSTRCLALRKNGTVLSWEQEKNRETLDVENWKNVIAVEQGFNYGIGLTSEGNVLYTDFFLNEREEIKKELSNWSDIIQISVNGGCIAGLKKDGSCLICEIW
ncbi:MAG: hypothetical protein OSJ62_06925 [Lachnospiraceae bacterium]|nr:hypothetical protein [Lachnospiraceae bacterium]